MRLLFPQEPIQPHNCAFLFSDAQLRADQELRGLYCCLRTLNVTWEVFFAEINTCGPCYPYGDDVKRLRREMAESGVEKMFWVGKTSEHKPLWHQLLVEFSIGFGTLFSNVQRYRAAPHPVAAISEEMMINLATTLRHLVVGLKRKLKVWRQGRGLCKEHVKGTSSWSRFLSAWNAFEKAVLAWLRRREKVEGTRILDLQECEQFCLDTRWEQWKEGDYGCACLECSQIKKPIAFDVEWEVRNDIEWTVVGSRVVVRSGWELRF